MPARIALAAVAVLIAAGMAVQLYAHGLQQRAAAQIGRELGGVKDTAAQRKALEDAERVADLRPGSGALFTAVGLEVQAGHLEDAERFAVRATGREPRNFATWVTLGIVRQARGDDVDARAAFARAKRLNPLYRTPQ